MEVKECPVIDNVGCKNIYEWEKEIGKKEITKLSSIDVFISNYVDNLIKNREP